MKARAHVELAQGLLDRRIQRQTLLLDQLQGRRGREPFGDATGAKRRIGCYRHALGFVGHAEATRPDQLLAIEQCTA